MQHLAAGSSSRETAVKGRCSAQNSAEITPGALVAA